MSSKEAQGKIREQLKISYMIALFIKDANQILRLQFSLRRL